MKVYLSIIACLLFSCSSSQKKITENLLPKSVFEKILKEIHLEEAEFELNKNKDVENAKIKLSKSYSDIYKKNEISEKDFEETLDYYSQNPEKLQQIYTNILTRLNKERSKFDLQ